MAEYSLDQRIQLINKWGSKNIPRYKAVNANYRRAANRHLYVLIINEESKETKEVKFSQLKRVNPFSRGTYKDHQVKKTINQLGQKAKYPFVCLNPNYKESSSKQRKVIIKSLNSNKKEVVFYHSLLEGKNPFNEDINREEVLKVQPLYEKLFKKLNISYKKEFRLDKNSIVDFKIKLPNKEKFDLVEVKKSSRLCMKKDQIIRYKSFINKNSNIDRLLLSDPKGSHYKHGFISIKELKKLLLKEINS